MRRVTEWTAEMRESSAWGRRLRVFWSAWDTRVSTFLLLLLLVAFFFPTEWLPARHTQPELLLRHLPPMTAKGDVTYWLGADSLGRDLFWRLVGSTRLTLLISGSATILATVAGTAAGLTAGYYGGRADSLVMRLVDIMLAFPVLLLALALVSSMGRSTVNLVLVLALSGWAGYTRVVRSAVLALRERDYVEAARATGATGLRIIWRHLLPNVMSAVLVLSTFNLARFILTESAISFLGLGPAPPDVTWGGIIGEGRNYIYEAWWVSAMPGAVIFLTVLVFNFLGDSMRDAFDPYTTTHRSGKG